MHRFVLASLAAGFLVLIGCDDSSDDSEDGGAVLGLPTDLEPGWNEIRPGGDTICSRGSEYAYWVRQGSVNKLVIDFIGGGACWDALTCSFGSALFSETVDSIRERIEAGVPSGFYDDQNPDNPFKDWYHVVIPYCTGDVHWGDAVAVYNEGQSNEFTIHHKGAVNSRAVLDWVFENFAAPEQIMVTGCSAGSYGSALWSAYVMQHYPSSQVFQFGDSGAGIITEQFFQESFPSWNAQAAFPIFIPALDPAEVDILDTAFPDLYVGIADFFPDQWMSQYNTTFDENQFFYYSVMLMMGDSTDDASVEDWSALMLDSIAEIESRAANFSAFIAPGEQHCILPYNNFYEVEANGVKLVDWLGDLLETGSVDSAKCQADECEGPTPGTP